MAVNRNLPPHHLGAKVFYALHACFQPSIGEPSLSVGKILAPPLVESQKRLYCVTSKHFCIKLCNLMGFKQP